MIGAEDIYNRFSYHPPTTETVKAYHEQVREACADVAQTFDQLLPDGREKSTAVTKLEEAMFWANAAIARNQGGGS